MAGLAQMFYNQYGRAPSFSELSTMSGGGNLAVGNQGSTEVTLDGSRKGDLSSFSNLLGDPSYTAYQNAPITGTNGITNIGSLASTWNNSNPQQQFRAEYGNNAPAPAIGRTYQGVSLDGSYAGGSPIQFWGSPLNSLYSVNRDPWNQRDAGNISGKTQAQFDSQRDTYSNPDFWNNIFKQMGWVK